MVIYIGMGGFSVSTTTKKGVGPEGPFSLNAHTYHLTYYCQIGMITNLWEGKGLCG